MSIPHNALPAAVKLRESALTAFKTYQDMKEGLNSAAAPTILGVAANYCVQLIDTKDPCLLMHQPMHNVLFLVRGEYNTRSTGVHAIAPPADLDTIKEYCRAVLAARAAAQVVPPPVTAQAQAQAEIAEVMAAAKAKAHKSANSLLIDNPLYREILARAHAAVTNRMPAYPTLAYFKQQEVDLRERVLLSMQRLDLELRLRDVLVADYEIALAQIAEREVTKE
ncbi:uncharacterized protein LACBIDRAFT_336315 [Laccaria bicolor S238N-H82]|uniref:Predicted protein n=1 Tax=Laccaria bicolor (strain S238N-H82 / ATCC MYA-4686) TaxID=486041 RepID=B0E529_LACBS|nr:uncharacterized protein LACBIDRAFT_336315 [Laccaria bicolor S238N-H82]EDQ98051.1 predicted protein [Laccaria bicolor S238N-H82]|eukprot:XP_001891297.1 predicted protein [Laccaria bicolor S238N-H82]